ncbi:conserved Plasmodium protein, unknown function [Plasmodium ovale]|uniref:Transcription factor Iwr1 domain-containing protein n=2 Tax=Plasmodium ovale TaxID=36330 RepID=A0A1A8W6L7_PLAOA|nr:conserved Plasmodium protein, unknown function [Plasmodium ovale curtisi]SBS98285.1 conserved Plasmodium protein, unknown function [Plasmodium ovale curtisi]SCQ16994.1 conserved Plasmodium protein, unknown function [Plasmodium ovale]
MYKDVHVGSRNKSGTKEEKKDEKVIIRLKRKVDDTSIPSIYVKSNKRVCGGIFYRHFDTLFPEVDEEKKNMESINSFLKHEECNASNRSGDELLPFAEKKRKFHSLKGYEKDLKEAINNLKRCKIVNQNVQYVDIDGEKKGTYKIIDVDILHKSGSDLVEGAQKGEDQVEEVEDYKTEWAYEYDLYILDNQKLHVQNYMDYMYNIKNNNVDASEVIVLEDVYGNNSNEYEANSFGSSSCERDTEKEMSDYPDESSGSNDGHSQMESDTSDPLGSDAYDRSSMDSDWYQNDFSDDAYGDKMGIDTIDEKSGSDTFGKEAESYLDIHDAKEDGIFANGCEDDLLRESVKRGGGDQNGSNENEENYFINFDYFLREKKVDYRNSSKDKNNSKKYKEKKLSTHNNKKVNTFFVEEKIKDEMEKRLKRENENLLNATLSDKLKILEQMENEYYDK